MVGDAVEGRAGETFAGEDLVHSWKCRLEVTTVAPFS